MKYLIDEDRTEITILGRVIGTASGWDFWDGSRSGNGMLFYEFEPKPDFHTPAPLPPPRTYALGFDPETGVVEVYPADAENGGASHCFKITWSLTLA